jgi:hypothetical protein
MIPIHFRKIKSTQAFFKFVDFLKEDVRINGGTASETVDVHGVLWDCKVTSSPWGPILIRQEVTKLEAIAAWFQFTEELSHE